MLKLLTRKYNDICPLLSILTVNYNSESFFNIVRAHLESLSQIPLPKEIIIVDNGSQDESSKRILEVLDELNCSNCSSIKLLLLSENLGFPKSINIALKLIDGKSKFLMITNNDMLVNSEGIALLVRVLGKADRIGCIQGKILRWDNTTIDSAGCIITGFGDWLKLGHKLSKDLLNVPYLVTYTHATLTICKRKTFSGFLPYFFVFGDDFELGPRLYVQGFVSMYFPVLAGRHYGSATSKFNKDVAELTRVWSTIGETALLRVVPLQGLNFVNRILRLIRVLIDLLTSTLRMNKIRTYGIVKGLILGLKLTHKRIELYKGYECLSVECPFLKMNFRDIPLLFVPRRRHALYLRKTVNFVKNHVLRF
jgi:GT2 family glycosyltransferase